jgi:hypothetical protein
MSMNLNDYQKVKADEKFSVLRHKNGSEFKIAHEGLSPSEAARIHKMPMFAGGGIASVLQSASNSLNGGSGGGTSSPILGNSTGGTNLSAITGGLGGSTGTSAPSNPAVAAPIQTPYTAAGVQGATADSETAARNLSGVAAQTNTGGSANLSNTYGVGTTLGTSIGNIGGQTAQTNAITQQGNLNTQTAGGASNGVAAQNSAVSGLQNNANQLQGIANGTGPNPAQAMLNQQTGVNVQNQAALMASQRGAGANPALLARQAAQQGAATQQQAVGQGATLQSQQQLNAINAGVGANTALAGVGAGQVGQSQTGINSLASQGATATGQQQGQNAQNAGIAQNQVSNQIGANTAITQADQNQQQIQTGGIGAQNSTIAGQQANVNTVGGTLANTALGNKAGLAGGLMNGAGAVLGSVLGGSGAEGAAADAAAARGGSIGMYDNGGGVGADGQPVGNMVMQNAPSYSGSMDITPPTQPTVPPPAANQPQSSFFNFLKNWTNTNAQGQTTGPVSSAAGTSGQALNQGATGLGTGIGKALSARGGKVKSLVSEGEAVIPPRDANSPDAAARDVARAKKDGGTIKAANASQKATKSGNSYANDKIEKDLPVGGIVIPRSVMNSKDPVRGTAEFVKAVMAKKGKQ